MREGYKRPYVYRQRPYNYRENLIREESRVRKNRKQLKFSDSQYAMIESKIAESNFDNFSEYIRDCIYNKPISSEQIEACKNPDGKKSNRKQICFSDEEVELIEQRMKELECDNFILFITAVAISWLKLFEKSILFYLQIHKKVVKWG